MLPSAASCSIPESLQSGHCYSRGLDTSIADNDKNRHSTVYVTGQTHSHAAVQIVPVLLNRLQILMVSSQHLITSKWTP